MRITLGDKTVEGTNIHLVGSSVRCGCGGALTKDRTEDHVHIYQCRECGNEAVEGTLRSINRRERLNGYTRK